MMEIIDEIQFYYFFYLGDSKTKQKMNNPKQVAIKRAFQIIQDKKGYSQITIVKKLNQLNFDVKSPSFNKILKDKKIGTEVLAKFLAGMKLLLSKEIGYQLTEDFVWEKLVNFEGEEISVLGKSNEKKGFVFHREGRLSLEDKVAFFERAQQEIIEFGTTLNSFSEYFVSRRAAVFKEPIRALLKKGVSIKCYLIDAEWPGAWLYFEDRNSPLDRDGKDKILNALRKLKIVVEEFEKEKFEGKFEVFTYRHIPHNYFLAIDKNDNKLSKMMISNYLYGVKRADCPVLEFTRKEEPTLFLRYKDSLEKLIYAAKKVDFSKISS